MGRGEAERGGEGKGRGKQSGKRGESEEATLLGDRAKARRGVSQAVLVEAALMPWDQHFISWRIWGRITVRVCVHKMQEQYSYSICRTVKPAFHSADPGMFKRKVPRQAP
jgi:hypothetical protein